ncbi:MAG: LURP-one-related family protein [Planctomycetota bacterium]
MIFRIQEKFWSLGGRFVITDDSGETRYIVQGKAFSWGNKLSFQDPNENEIAFINQKLMSWKPRYEIVIDGSVFAEVVKEWTWFKKTFTLDVPGPNDYTITGSFWAHEFNFDRGGKSVARVSKKVWAWTDSYGVEITEGEDETSILCACIVIDQVLHDGSAQTGGGT